MAVVVDPTPGTLDTEAVDDRVAALIVPGAGISEVYDDGANTLTLSIADDGVTYSKLPNIDSGSVIGRFAAGVGDPQQVQVAGGLEITVGGVMQVAAYTGDVTKVAGGTALSIPLASIEFNQIQNIATDKLVGRDAAGSGSMQEIGVTGGIEFNNALGIQTSAFTGDVTKAAAGTVLTVSAVYSDIVKARANHTGTQLAATISDFAEAVDDRANTLIIAGTGIVKTYDDTANTLTIESKAPSYTVIGVPSASGLGAGSMIYVSNETGGAVIAFSDGTNWRRVTDRAIIA